MHQFARQQMDEALKAPNSGNDEKKTIAPLRNSERLRNRTAQAK